MGVPLRCVVDTNVAVTANNGENGAGPACMAASARALQRVMEAGHVFVDAGGRIVEEYRLNLRAKGQPGPGDAFLRWILTYEWGGTRVTRVPITRRETDPEGYEELSTPPSGIDYDPSDTKFLAVSAAHPERPPVLQSFDSKWWGWRSAGVPIHFLCPDEIAAKHAEKHID
jgi:hypothetical protein